MLQKPTKRNLRKSGMITFQTLSGIILRLLNQNDAGTLLILGSTNTVASTYLFIEVQRTRSVDALGRSTFNAVHFRSPFLFHFSTRSRRVSIYFLVTSSLKQGHTYGLPYSQYLTAQRGFSFRQLPDLWHFPPQFRSEICVPPVL